MAAPAPDPASPLGRYRRLSPTAGVYVSPVQLGAMSLGSKWAHVGSCTKDAAFAHLDAYFGAGGNVIDTANAYQDGESEAWIGEWMEARNVRDQVVVATKYTGCTGYWDPRVQQKATLLGNSAKSLRVSVEASLKALHTAYIDILYVHWWDWTTSVEELMDALHALVAAGKVLYLVRRIRRLSAAAGTLTCAGRKQHPRVGRVQGKPVRARPRPSAVRHLSGRVERPQARRRARHTPHVPR